MFPFVISYQPGGVSLRQNRPNRRRACSTWRLPSFGRWRRPSHPARG